MTTPTVLIADNDPGVASILRLALTRAGYHRIEVVDNGAAALSRLGRGDVELLVCDLDMPGISGEQLVAELDSWDDPPPTLVVSAYLDPAVVRDLERSRAVRGTLSKPFALDRFAAAVREVLGPAIEGSSESAQQELF